MEVGEIVKVSASIVAGLVAALKVAASWYAKREEAREAERKDALEKERTRADVAHATLIAELRDRIEALEEEIRVLRENSCLVKGCLQRRQAGLAPQAV